MHDAVDADLNSVSRQHVVSQVLLRRLARRHHRNGAEISSYDLRHARTYPKSPKACGYVREFVRFRSRAAEDLWAMIENRMPAALAAVQNDAVFDAPDHAATIKECIVLHYFRSLRSRAIHEQTWLQVAAQNKRDLLANRELLRRLALLKYGLHIEDGRVLEDIADELLRPSTELHDSGAWFQARLEEYLEIGRARVAASGLEISRADRGEFLIGDCPAVGVRREPSGFRLGVAFGDADSVVVPIGPKTIVGLGKSDSVQTLPESFVDDLNRMQNQPGT